MGGTYYMYIVCCSDKSFYTGITNNIQRRIQDHNTGNGSVYTAKRRPVILVYIEKFSTRKDACKRETQIKGWTKQKKIHLIQHKHPNAQ